MENTILSTTEIRKQIKSDLPTQAFKRVPSKALLYIPLNLIVLASVFVAYHNSLQWYWLVMMSVLLGQVYATIAFLAHDISHGSVLKSKRWSDFLVYFGMYPFLVSPHLWRVWHVMAHHGNTNTSKDPDVIVNLEEYGSIPITRVWTEFIPCSRNPVAGVLFFLYWFTLHAQHIIWFNKHYKSWNFESYGFNKLRGIVDTLMYLVLWSVVWSLLGWYKSLFVIVLPMMIANAILLVFIATEHTCMPRSDNGKNDPLVNTISVQIPSIMAKFNINFNNHVEHHLFPSMNYQYTPLVRKWLQENMHDQYLEPSLSRALFTLFSTPRIYAGEDILCYPEDIEGTKVNTKKTRDMLSGNN